VVVLDNKKVGAVTIRLVDVRDSIVGTYYVAPCWPYDKPVKEKMDSLAEKVRKLLHVELAWPASFEEVAASLRMSPRTLRRKLREEGTSFREVISEVRIQLVEKHLGEMILTLEEIAHGLGFRNAAGLRRAIARWTRAAPARRQASSKRK